MWVLFFASYEGKYVQRNPAVYKSTCINVHCKDNGTLYPTFNRPKYNDRFTFKHFCREAAEELLMVAGAFDKICLVKEVGCK